MATVDSKKIIDEMLASDGVYPGDPQAFAIYEYTNDWGKVAWSVCYNKAAAYSFETSPHVHNVRLLWSKARGLEAKV
jgi:hypothetical protein